MKYTSFFKQSVAATDAASFQSFIRPVLATMQRDTNIVTGKIVQQHADGLFWHSSRNMPLLMNKFKSRSSVAKLCCSFLVGGPGSNVRQTVFNPSDMGIAGVIFNSEVEERGCVKAMYARDIASGYGNDEPDFSPAEVKKQKARIKADILQNGGDPHGRNQFYYQLPSINESRLKNIPFSAVEAFGLIIRGELSTHPMQVLRKRYGDNADSNMKLDNNLFAEAVPLLIGVFDIMAANVILHRSAITKPIVIFDGESFKEFGPFSVEDLTYCFRLHNNIVGHTDFKGILENSADCNANAAQMQLSSAERLFLADKPISYRVTRWCENLSSKGRDSVFTWPDDDLSMQASMNIPRC